MSPEFDRSPIIGLVRDRDRDRFLTALFAPADRRDDLCALYAFNYELAKTREVVHEPMLGRIRLQWWRESIDAIYDGRPVRHHEVVRPLADAISRRNLSREHLVCLIDAREHDIGDEPPVNLPALEAYAESTSARLVLLALEVLGVDAGAATAAATDIGIAYALTGLSRAIPFHARAKRHFLPADFIAESGLRVYQDLFELKSSPALAHIVARISEAARIRLAAAATRRGEIPRSALPALLPAVLARADLARLARAGHDPFDPGLAALDPWRSWRLAFAAMMHRY